MRVAILLAAINIFPLFAGKINSNSSDQDYKIVHATMTSHLMPKNASSQLSATIEKLYYHALSRIPAFFKEDKAYIQYGNELYEIDMERKNIIRMVYMS